MYFKVFYFSAYVCLHFCVHTSCRSLWRPEEVVRTTGNGAAGSCEPLVLGLNSGSFKEWKVLLTIEPSLQPLIICSFKNSVVTAFKGQFLHNRNMINGKHLLFRRWDLSYYNYNWCISGCNYITGKFTSEAL